MTTILADEGEYAPPYPCFSFGMGSDILKSDGLVVTVLEG